ncbi:mitochondrial glycoprotein [Suillus lakei]|nr:mitochondrial glycoprotein [Suillus lakei]
MPSHSGRFCEYCAKKTKYVDGMGKVHPYCGKTCANAAKTNPKGAAASHRGGFDNASQQAAKLSRTISEELTTVTRALGNNVDTNFITTFKRQGTWQYSDAKGSSEIVLTRNFNNERISVVFSLSDMEQLDGDSDSSGEDGFDSDGSSHNGDDSDSESEENDGDEAALNCTVTISKPNKGVMLVRCSAIGGVFQLDNVSYTNNTNLATVKSAEEDFSRQNVYIAPDFDILPSGLQEQLNEFLEIRGINDDLARFIQEYSKHKEQLEQIHWLKGLQAFIS